MNKLVSFGKIIKRLKKTITFTYTNPTMTPPVSGPDYVFTNENNEFTVTTSGYDSIVITATNADVDFNSSTGALVIYNVTGNVNVSIAAEGETVTLVFHSASYSTSQGFRGQWPGAGTITYTDKYGNQQTANVADMVPWPSGGAWPATSSHKIILKNTPVICTNIKTISTSEFSLSDITYGQGNKTYNGSGGNTILYTGAGSGSSYTFPEATGPYLVISVVSY